eukprot:PhF_6_TR11007/c0_g1_i2/m.17821
MDGISAFWGEYLKDNFFYDTDENGTPLLSRVPRSNARTFVSPPPGRRSSGVTTSSPTSSQNSEVVLLNVGGRRMATTRTTLLSLREEGNFFATMLGSDVPPLVDVDGYVFLDRDPDIFAAILAYARGGIQSLKEFSHLPDETMHNEFDYFLLPMPKLLGSILTPSFFVKEGDYLSVLWVDEDMALSHTLRWFSGVMFGVGFLRVEVNLHCLASSVQFPIAPGRTVEITLREHDVI